MKQRKTKLVKYINKLTKTIEDNKVIFVKDLKKLQLNDDELNYIKCLLEQYNIELLTNESSLGSDNILQKFIRYSRTKDINLRNELVVAHINLVRYIAFENCITTRINVSDLESYGYDGLINAVEKFNPYLGYTFTSYAYTSIKRSISMGIAKLEGYNQSKFYNDFHYVKRLVEKKRREKLQDNLNLVDDIVKQLADFGCIDNKYIESTKNRILLNMPESIDNYSDGDYIDNGLYDDNTLYYNSTIELLRSHLINLLDELSDQEKTIIYMRFGFDDGIIYTLNEIGQIHGLSSAGIRRIEKKALRKLRYSNKIQEFKEYYYNLENNNYNPNYIKQRKI